jgi:hypothetical protein
MCDVKVTFTKQAVYIILNKMVYKIYISVTNTSKIQDRNFVLKVMFFV